MIDFGIGVLDFDLRSAEVYVLTYQEKFHVLNQASYSLFYNRLIVTDDVIDGYNCRILI